MSLFVMVFGICFVVLIANVRADSVNVYNIKNVNRLIVKKEGKIKFRTNLGNAVKWKSSNTKVAKVSKKGRVKTLKCGKTMITAKTDGKKYRCMLTVKKRIKKANANTVKMLITYNNGIAEIEFINDSDQLINVTSSEFEQFINGKWESVALKGVTTGAEPYENVQAGERLLRKLALPNQYNMTIGIYRKIYTVLVGKRRIYIGDIFEIQ